jgi:GT2 family glycosyltransferase
VDNDSRTGEGARLAAEFGPSVTALALDENGGVPAGYNAALRWAAAAGAEHMLLLNNDTVLSDPDLIDRLVAAMGPDIAAVGPVIRDKSGAVQSAGGRLRLAAGRASHLTTPAHADRPYEAAWLDGSCLLVAIAAARMVGGLETDYFLYWEEVDWCVRARRAGFRCLVEPRVSITHLGSVSVSGQQKLHYWMRNKLLFMRRNAPASANAWALLAFIVRTVPHQLVLQGVSPRRWRWVLAAAVRALAWNGADAVRRGSWLRSPDGPEIGG